MMNGQRVREKNKQRQSKAKRTMGRRERIAEKRLRHRPKQRPRPGQGQAARRTFPHSGLLRMAELEGRSAAERSLPADAPDEREPSSVLLQLQATWRSWLQGRGLLRLSPARTTTLMHAYVRGWDSRRRLPIRNPVLTRVGPNRRITAVITAMNEEERIRNVILELNRLPLHEITVVVNGTTDRTLERCREVLGANGLIIHIPHALGHDVGRGLGARSSTSDIILFLDGDLAVPAEMLVPFLEAIDSGYDVALNNLTPQTGLFQQRDGVSVVKEFLNVVMGRGDLGINSMTAVPHAMSRRAVESIGCPQLAVPPAAQAAAIRKGLRIAAPIGIDVFRRNRKRTSNVGRLNPLARLIIGDHLEAISSLMASEGKRLSFPDSLRSRIVLKGVDS